MEDEQMEAANVLHVFCALYLLSAEELHGLDGKVAALVPLFDLDRSGGLSRGELEALFHGVVQGLSRATGTKPPTYALEAVSEKARDFRILGCQGAFPDVIWSTKDDFRCNFEQKRQKSDQPKVHERNGLSRTQAAHGLPREEAGL